MLSKASERIHAWARGRVVLGSIVAFVLIVSLPVGDPTLLSMSLDGQIGYTPEEAFAVITSYGGDGRLQMVWIHLLDFVLIALYTLMFCLAISWLIQRGFGPDSKARRLNLVPILGSIFDVLENIWILTLIWVYPGRPTAVAWLSTISTTSKYVMGALIILLLLVGLVKAAGNKFRVKGAETREVG